MPREQLHQQHRTSIAGRDRGPQSAVAIQGTVRAIWESLDKPYRAAMDQGLMYHALGNPVGLAEIQERGVDRTPPTVR